MTEQTPDQRLIAQREALKKSGWVTVLNDGDTYTGLDGCHIALTSDEQVEGLDADKFSVDDLPAWQRFSLNELLMLAIDLRQIPNDRLKDTHGRDGDGRVPPPPPILYPSRKSTD